MASAATMVPNMQVVDAFWVLYSGHLNSGAWDKVEMPINIKFVIGQKGIDILAARFRSVYLLLPSTRDHADP